MDGLSGTFSTGTAIVALASFAGSWVGQHENRARLWKVAQAAITPLAVRVRRLESMVGIPPPPMPLKEP